VDEPVVTVTFADCGVAVEVMTRLTVAVCGVVLGVFGETETVFAVTPVPKLNTGNALFPVGSAKFEPLTVTLSVCPW
jgi:hypothetical protein